MKSIVKEDNNEIKYPCLMIGIETGIIILAYGDSDDKYEHMEGIVLSEGHMGLKLGYISNGWCKDNFIPFKGVVELSND